MVFCKRSILFDIIFFAKYDYEYELDERRKKYATDYKNKG